MPDVAGEHDDERGGEGREHAASQAGEGDD